MLFLAGLIHKRLMQKHSLTSVHNEEILANLLMRALIQTGNYEEKPSANMTLMCNVVL